MCSGIMFLSILAFQVCYPSGSATNATSECCVPPTDRVQSKTWLQTITSGYLKQSPTAEHLYHVTHDNILESVVDLMLYWERYDLGYFLVEKHLLGLGVEAAHSYLKRRLRSVDLTLVDSGDDIDPFLRRVQFTYVNMVVICGENSTNDVMQQAKQMVLFSTNHTWMVYSENGSIPSKLVGVDITPESQVTLISPRNRRMSMADMDIFDVFHSMQTNATEMVKFAEWNEISGLFMLEVFDEKDQEQRLRGRRIRTVVFQHPPYTMLRTVGGRLTVTGYLKDMFDMLMETVNVRYSMKQVDEVFGIGINGTFTGFVGILFRREAEMAINALAMTNSRQAGIRYIGPAMKASLAIMSNKPESVIPPGTYLMPFSATVWMYTGILLLMLVAMLAVINLFEHKACPEYNPEPPAIDQRHQSIALRLTTFDFYVEISENAVSYSAKVIYGTFLVTSVVICAYYTSVFTSFLAYHEEKVPFNDLHDVASSQDHTILVVRNTRHHDILQYATTGVYVDVWRRIVMQGDKSFVRNFETGVEQTYSGKYVFLSDGPTLMFLSAENCSVSFAPKVYTREHWCAASRRDFPFSRIFTKLLMQLMEGGILNRLSIVYKANRRQVCTNSNPNSSFGLSQVIGVFLVWQAAVLLAVICLMVERQVHNINWTFRRRRGPPSKRRRWTPDNKLDLNAGGGGSAP